MKWIGHRGLHRDTDGQRIHAENSMVAFEAARDAGCDGIETDVQLSREGHPVLVHDRFDGPAGKLVRLETFLEAFPKLELLVEAKVFEDTDRPALLNAILEGLQGHLDHASLLCFDLPFLQKAQDLCPSLRCILNLAEGNPPPQSDFVWAFSCNIDALSPEFPAKDRLMMTWTCNEKSQIEHARRCQVDYIMSDKAPKRD